jgi:hypothetical protein
VLGVPNEQFAHMPAASSRRELVTSTVMMLSSYTQTLLSSIRMVVFCTLYHTFIPSFSSFS